MYSVHAENLCGATLYMRFEKRNWIFFETDVAQRDVHNNAIEILTKYWVYSKTVIPAFFLR